MKWSTVSWTLCSLLVVAVSASGQNTTTAADTEIFWGKKVLRKSLEQKVALGGDVEYRAMAYWMECSSRCVENPQYIGELWSGRRLLARGLEGPYAGYSQSPSKRFVI